MGQGGFEELQAWQRSKDLAVGIYRFTEEGAISKAFGLREQLRRSAVSVPSNLAEGDERGTDKEAVRFFYIAKRFDQGKADGVKCLAVAPGPAVSAFLVPNAIFSLNFMHRGARILFKFFHIDTQGSEFTLCLLPQVP